MKIKSEDEILDPEIRKAVLSEIKGTENVRRKKEALKRYEIYKDLTKKYVIEALESELEGETVDEMKSRASNISLAKKIINKKARVYKHGVKREVLENDKNKSTLVSKLLGKDKKAKAEKEAEQAKVDDIYSILKGNQEFKKANRFLELQKNTAMQILPIPDGKGKFYLKMRILNSHVYDVIEDFNDPEKPLVYILSFFHERNQNTNIDVLDGGDGRGITTNGSSSFRHGDTIDQKIADSEADQGIDQTRHIWWSKSWHFTTNAEGSIINTENEEIISQEEAELDPTLIENPIGMQSIISLNKDQDGNYWAVGGEDLIDGSILFNVLLTDLYFIAKLHGTGIFFAIGPDVPKRIKAGPNHGITIDTKDQESGITPQIGFASANPPLKAHMEIAEQYAALLLTTNNLAPSTVQGRLQASTASSGILELVIRSEVTGDIEDERQVFEDAEPEVFEVIKSWQNLFMEKDLLRDDFKEIGSFKEDTKIKPIYMPFQEFLTEEQKLSIIKTRRELGLDTMVDSLMRDDPNLKKRDAEVKLLDILQDKLKRSQLLLRSEFINDENKTDEDIDVDEDDEEVDKDDARVDEDEKKVDKDDSKVDKDNKEE